MTTDNLDFPSNRHNLVNGSMIKATREGPGFTTGLMIVIGWNGQQVCFNSLRWSVEQLCQDIDTGIWVIMDKALDLSDPKQLQAFSMFCR